MTENTRYSKEASDKACKTRKMNHTSENPNDVLTDNDEPVKVDNGTVNDQEKKARNDAKCGDCNEILEKQKASTVDNDDDGCTHKIENDVMNDNEELSEERRHGGTSSKQVNSTAGNECLQIVEEHAVEDREELSTDMINCKMNVMTEKPKDALFDNNEIIEVEDGTVMEQEEQSGNDSTTGKLNVMTEKPKVAFTVNKEIIEVEDGTVMEQEEQSGNDSTTGESMGVCQSTKSEITDRDTGPEIVETNEQEIIQSMDNDSRNRELIDVCQNAKSEIPNRETELKIIETTEQNNQSMDNDSDNGELIDVCPNSQNEIPNRETERVVVETPEQENIKSIENDSQNVVFNKLLEKQENVSATFDFQHKVEDDTKDKDEMSNDDTNGQHTIRNIPLNGAEGKMIDSEKMPEDDSKDWEQMDIFDKPMCLITAKNGRLEAVEETVNNLERIECPLNVVAIAGLYRTGKSYLMNRLAGKTSGFLMGSSIESTTKGIWAWCKRHPTKESEVLLLLDTEGLGDVKKGSIDQDHKIFTITTLLSSTLVFNTMSAFNQEAVEKLTFVSMMSDNLKVSSSDSGNVRLDCVMPQFVLCLRDFNLELCVDGQEMSGDEYLEDCLKTKEVKTSEDENYNRPRECIKKFFPRRKVFTFDRPANRKIMRHLDAASDTDLSEDFLQETEFFLSFIYASPAKVLHDQSPVTGSMLAKLLRIYVTAIGEGSIPCIEDAVMTMARLENDRNAKVAVEAYKQFVKELQLPIFNREELLVIYITCKEQALSQLRTNLLFDTDSKVEKTVEAEIEGLFEKVDKKNRKLIHEQCIAKIRELHQQRINTNIEKGKYAVSGGHTMYSTDMQRLYDEYNKELNVIDLVNRQKAQTMFEKEMLSESKEILDRDKICSQEDVKETVAGQVEVMKQIALRAHEEDMRRHDEELEKQRKHYDRQMSKMRKEEEERRKEESKMHYEDLKRIACSEAENKYRGEIEELKRQQRRLENKFYHRKMHHNQTIPQQEKGNWCLLS